MIVDGVRAGSSALGRSSFGHHAAAAWSARFAAVCPTNDGKYKCRIVPSRLVSRRVQRPWWWAATGGTTLLLVASARWLARGGHVPRRPVGEAAAGGPASSVSGTDESSSTVGPGTVVVPSAIAAGNYL